jgi:glycosyltransferase involved in cell wall biosynthesis
MNPMRVLLINDSASPIGGAELNTLCLRQELNARGHDARLFASSIGDGEQSDADYTCFATTSPLQAFTRAANPSAYLQLRRVLRDFRPDVVHVRMFLTQLSPLIMRAIAGYPSIFHVTDYSAICPRGTKLLPDGSPCTQPAGVACRRFGCVSAVSWAPLMVQLGLFRRWRSAFSVVATNSHAVAARMAEAGIGPTEVIWNGVPVRPQRGPLTDPPTAALAGRLTSEKGIDVAVASMARVVEKLPTARLLIAGEGPERARLTDMIQRLGLTQNVTLLGRVPRERLDEAFGTAWVQVVPSKWAEPFGNVAAEGLMRGTAVIATNAGGLAEIVTHNDTGMLTPAGDVDALADAMLTIMGDRHLAEQMGSRGRERAIRHFSVDRFITDFEALYARLTGLPTSVSTEGAAAGGKPPETWR